MSKIKSPWNYYYYFEIVMTETIEEIKINEKQKPENAGDALKIDKAIDNLFMIIQKKYILDNFVEMKKIEHHLNITLEIPILEGKEMQRKRNLEMQREKYNEKMKYIYHCLMFYLSEIKDNKIEIEYENDKTQVAKKTMDELDKIIKSNFNYKEQLKKELAKETETIEKAKEERIKEDMKTKTVKSRSPPKFPPSIGKMSISRHHLTRKRDKKTNIRLLEPLPQTMLEPNLEGIKVINPIPSRPKSEKPLYSRPCRGGNRTRKYKKQIKYK